MRRLCEAPRESHVNRWKAVYINHIHDKTIQWETLKKYCSIINEYIYIYILFQNGPVIVWLYYFDLTLNVNTVRTEGIQITLYLIISSMSFVK